MIDREKVIKGLECLAQKQAASPNPCRDCGYVRRVNFAYCVKDVAADALELLKEQEIIRCAECKYWHINCMENAGRHGCDVIGDYTGPDYYCASAERR